MQKKLQGVFAERRESRYHCIRMQRADWSRPKNTSSEGGVL